MFITLEGPEGSGKSTHIAALTEAIKNEAYTVVPTREPGGTPIGKEIRETLLNFKNIEMHPTTEILLFQASRAQLVNQLIRPSLQEGKVVVCDRYADSTMAYQGYGHQTDLTRLAQIIDFATGGLVPDLTVLLDIEVEQGLKRRSSDSDNWNRLDAKEIAFHQRVRQGYLQLAAQEPQRWVIIDASRNKEQVEKDLIQVVLERLAAAGPNT